MRGVSSLNADCAPGIIQSVRFQSNRISALMEHIIKWQKQRVNMEAKCI